MAGRISEKGMLWASNGQLKGQQTAKVVRMRLVNWCDHEEVMNQEEKVEGVANEMSQKVKFFIHFANAVVAILLSQLAASSSASWVHHRSSSTGTSTMWFIVCWRLQSQKSDVTLNAPICANKYSMSFTLCENGSAMSMFGKAGRCQVKLCPHQKQWSVILTAELVGGTAKVTTDDDRVQWKGWETSSGMSNVKKFVGENIIFSMCIDLKPLEKFKNGSDTSEFRGTDF